MAPKRLRRLVTFLLTFVVVLTTLGALVGLLAVFAPDRFSELPPQGKGAALLSLFALAALMAWVGPWFRRAIGLGGEEANDGRSPYDFGGPNHRANRDNVIGTVRAGYIEGVLRRAMPEQVRLNLDLAPVPDALLRPPIRWEGEAISPAPVTSADIYRVFTSGSRALLILGEPGAGKTITLLELCAALLDDAAADLNAPVPVVLNLSTWATARKPLDEWLVDELLRQYSLAPAVSRAWLAAGQLVLLLDGLDEVRPEAQSDCVAAINAFRAAPGGPLTVCCRRAAYHSLATPLNLMQAVRIEPLAEAQVAAYLADPRLQLGAAAAVAEDAVLRELTTTPLLLNVMAVAYGGASPDALGPPGQDAAQRRAHLYDAYIRRVLRRRPPGEAGYDAAQSLRRLRYLAGQMTRRDETQFFVEGLQFDWLGAGEQRVARGVGGYLFGVVFGVVFGVLGSLFGVFGAVFGVLGGVVLGVLGGVLYGISPIQLVEELEIARLNRRAVGMIVITFLVGVLASVLAGVVVYILDPSQVNLLGYVQEVVLISVLFGVGSGVLGGVLELVRPVESRRRLRPNQGIRRSAVNAIRAGLLTAILVGVPFGILNGFRGDAPFDALGGTLFGITFGVLGGVWYGGEAVIRHYTLRLLLAAYGYLPVRLVPFLEAMDTRDLLRRTGASYRFIHRTFQEHVAALTDEAIAGLAGGVSQGG